MAHTFRKITAPREVTYLGRRTIVQSFQIAGAHGVRVEAMTHIDEADPRNGAWAAGSVTGGVIKGDNRKGTLEVLVLRQTALPGESVDAMAERLVALVAS